MAREAKRTLARMARPAGDFDVRRYFRGAGDLGFYNIGTAAMRSLARSIHAQHKTAWSIDEAMAFAGALVAISRPSRWASKWSRAIAATSRPGSFASGSAGWPTTIPPTGRRPTRSAAR
jgi:hypothetical protein